MGILLDSTNKILCTPGLRGKEQWTHKRLSQTSCECLRVSCGGVGQQWPPVGTGVLAAAVWKVCVGISPFWSYLPGTFWSLCIPGLSHLTRGTQPQPSADTCIKDLLSMALPTTAGASFPQRQSLPSGFKSYKPSLQNENHNPRKLTKMPSWITASCNSRKLWAMPCRGYPRWTGHSGEL